MSEQPVNVSTDGFESWNDDVRRAENGETVALIAHRTLLGRFVAGVQQSGLGVPVLAGGFPARPCSSRNTRSITEAGTCDRPELAVLSGCRPPAN